MEHLPKRIIMVRHPFALNNQDYLRLLREGISNRNAPVTEGGWLQAEMTAKWILTNYGTPDLVFCSKFLRTKAIPEAMGLVDVQAVEALNERNMGIWHTLPPDQVFERYPEELAIKAAQSYYAYQAPEGGESCSDVEDRIQPFLSTKALFEGNPDTMFVSGHGVAGHCFRKLVLGETVEDWVRLYEHNRLRNASVTVFERHRGPAGFYYRCTLYNHIPWHNRIAPELLKKVSRHDD